MGSLLSFFQLDHLALDAAREKKEMEQKHSTIQQKVPEGEHLTHVWASAGQGLAAPSGSGPLPAGNPWKSSLGWETTPSPPTSFGSSNRAKPPSRPVRDGSHWGGSWAEERGALPPPLPVVPGWPGKANHPGYLPQGCPLGTGCRCPLESECPLRDAKQISPGLQVCRILSSRGYFHCFWPEAALTCREK